ncbi:MAG TPA: SdrD B-like domain-containing protein, partial [Humisphaera sp.]
MSASAAGDVYLDANGNGAEDPGETYLAGFRVYADLNQNGSADAGEPATLSDNLGKFQLAGLAAGTVRLAQEAQPGYTVTEPAGGFVDVTLADGQVADVDFGNHPDNPSGIIRGSIFNDANGDGVQNLGEPYQAGWTAYVDANLNGQPDAGEPTATTDGTGYFAFQGLSPGTYRVREVVQGGWAQTRPSAGYYDVPLAAGQTVVDRIFGNRQLPPPGAKVVGQVFNDSNADGLKQSAEVGVPGVTVFLDANANGLPDAGEATAVTNAGGSYSFTGLAGGTYQVIQVVPAGYRATTPVAAGVTVAANGTAVLTFGDTQKALLAGTVWDDANGNGVRDAGEPGIAGRSVFLDLNKNFNQDAGEPVATTDAAWAYAFNVAAGAYRVREVIPASGWRTT